MALRNLKNGDWRSPFDRNDGSPEVIGMTHGLGHIAVNVRHKYLSNTNQWSTTTRTSEIFAIFRMNIQLIL